MYLNRPNNTWRVVENITITKIVHKLPNVAGRSTEWHTTCHRAKCKLTRGFSSPLRNKNKMSHEERQNIKTFIHAQVKIGRKLLLCGSQILCCDHLPSLMMLCLCLGRQTYNSQRRQLMVWQYGSDVHEWHYLHIYYVPILSSVLLFLYNFTH